MQIWLPLRQYCSITFASVPVSPRLYASQSMNMGSSSHWPVCVFFRRFVTANPNLATLPPVAKVRHSGSRVRRPMRITLLRLAISVPPGKVWGCLGGHNRAHDTPVHQQTPISAVDKSRSLLADLGLGRPARLPSPPPRNG